MRLLELFSGTGSVGRAFEAAGWEVTSLDADLRTPADIHADILTFDFRVWHPGHFDAIWASPPCTEYSIARTTARTPRDLDLADSLVQRAIDAIIYLRPTVWWIENPATGLLRTRPVVDGSRSCLSITACMVPPTASALACGPTSPSRSPNFRCATALAVPLPTGATHRQPSVVLLGP